MMWEVKNCHGDLEFPGEVDLTLDIFHQVQIHYFEKHMENALDVDTSYLVENSL